MNVKPFLPLLIVFTLIIVGSVVFYYYQLQLGNTNSFAIDTHYNPFTPSNIPKTVIAPDTNPFAYENPFDAVSNDSPYRNPFDGTY